MLNSWLARAYPTASIESSTVSIASTIKPPFKDFSTCGHVDSQLSSIRASDIDAGSVDPRTHYYGLVSDSAGVVTGAHLCAVSPISRTRQIRLTGSGPAGQGLFGDTDASYADWYGGHEIGHTFGRKHPGFCGESKDDANYPFPNGTISDVEGSFVALDVGDPTVDNNTGAVIAPNSPNTVPIPLTVLPGTTTTEIMTYCAQPQWLSSYTYEAILTRMNAENAKFPAESSLDSATEAQIVSRSAIHVVAEIDLTSMTGSISYVLPVSRQYRVPSTGPTAEFVVLDSDGEVLSTTPAAVKSSLERSEGRRS